MNGADHEIEAGQQLGLVIVVQTAVRKDVGFDALEEPDALAVLVVPGIDLLVLLADFIRRKAAGVSGVL